MKRSYRQREKRKQTLQGLTLFGAVIATVLFCIWWFPKIDCHNAQSGLAFIERCEADPNCELRPQDRNLKRHYIRLELKACENAIASDID